MKTELPRKGNVVLGLELKGMSEDKSLKLVNVEILPVARSFWKRTLDLCVAAIVLLLTFPIWVLVALMVKFTSPGPILYKAKRVGLGGEDFYMFKFRTMYQDAEKRIGEVWNQNTAEGPFFKIKKDPRITPIGHILRKYSLDELPQFLNVFIGDTSVVGPRALTSYEIVQLGEEDLKRLSVKPGITCYWQIGGRSNCTPEQRLAMDRQYLSDIGLWTDIKLIVRTPFEIIKGEGAY